MYVPKLAPGGDSVDDLEKWATQEFQEIQKSLSVQDFLVLKEYHEPPAKYKNGLVVLADGTDWDPGSGAGVYCYYGNAWNKLG